MGWKKIGLMKRPDAGGEARKRASFLSEILLYGRGDFGTAGRDYSYIF